MVIDSLHLKLCYWVERLSRIKAFDVFYSDVLNFLRVDLIPHHNRSEQRAPKTNRKSTHRAMVSHRSATYPEVRGKGVPFVLHGERQVLGIWQDCSTRKYPRNGANETGLHWKLKLIF
jgi:hypothetical protein